MKNKYCNEELTLCANDSYESCTVKCRHEKNHKGLHRVEIKEKTVYWFDGEKKSAN